MGVERWEGGMTGSRKFRWMGALLVLAMVGTACTREVEDPDDEVAAGDETDESEEPVDETEDPDPEATESEAAGTPATGVEDNVVKIALHAKVEECAGSTGDATDAVVNDAARDMADQYIAWFNDEVLSDYGWQLEHELVNDGGNGCPEQARAAAQQIVREMEPFAVLGSSNDGPQGPIMADEVTSAGIPHIGINFNTLAELEDRKGLAFNVYIPAELSHQYLADYIGTRVAGTQTENLQTGEMEDRVYGIAMPDTERYQELAGLLTDKLAEYGVEVAQTYLLSTDAEVVAQTALTTANRMRDDGVNTLILDFFPVGFNSGVALTENMASQDYLPEILIGTYGIPIFDQSLDSTVMARAQGISSFSALALRSAYIEVDGEPVFDPEFQDVAENTEPFHEVWEERLGNNTELQVGVIEGLNFANLWQELSVLAVGLMGNPYDEVGGEITREGFAEAVWETAVGEDRRCDLERFLGGTAPNHHVYSEGDGVQDGFHNRFTTVYWVNEPTLLTQGYYESFDNYEYFDSGDELPTEPTRDTGEEGVELTPPEPVGLRPWVPCSELDGQG